MATKVASVAKAAWSFILWLQLQDLCSRPVYSSPLDFRPTALSLTVSNSSILDQSLNLTIPDVVPARFPFTIPDIGHNPSEPEWLYFFSSGVNFDTSQRLTISWNIGALLLKFSELDDNITCPSYVVNGQDTYLALEIMRSRPPTVAFCKRMIVVFDTFIQALGVKELGLTFGVGKDYKEQQGSFAIGLGKPLVDLVGAGGLDDA